MDLLERENDETEELRDHLESEQLFSGQTPNSSKKNLRGSIPHTEDTLLEGKKKFEPSSELDRLSQSKYLSQGSNLVMTTTYKKNSQESGASLEQSESTKKIY